ncbi:MAG: efflux RND transporter periplasmic adaptor subunit [Thiolinea sp.]
MKPFLQCLGGAVLSFILLGSIQPLMAADETEKQAEKPQGPPPATVSVLTVEPEDVSVSYEYVGQIAGSRELEVRSRITGIVEQRLFEEGSQVKEGDLLYVLESDTFRVAYEQAEAALKQAEAAVLSAEANRASALAGVTSAEAERDNAMAGIRSAEAGRQNALAGVRSVEAGRQNNAAERANAKAAIANAAAARQSVDAGLASSTAQLRQVQQEFNRVSTLVGKKLLSRNELDKVQAALSVAQANVAASQANSRQAAAAYQQAETGLQKANAAATQVEANVTQAQSVVKQADAGLLQAQSVVTRVEAAVEQARSVVKQADAAIEQARAGVLQAKANVNAAKINLDYVEVRSPATGVAGRAQKVVGSLVQAGNDSLLTTVAQIDPVYVNFGMPEAEYLNARDQRAAGELILPDGNFEVFLSSSDGKQLQTSGQVSFQDYRVDQNTGNVSMRATIPNPEGLLSPGQFVRVRLSGAVRPDAITLPQRAVLDNPQGKYVYVLAPGQNGSNIALARPVQVGQWNIGADGAKNWVIHSGLEKGDQVIIDGMARIFFSGMPVKLAEQGETAADDQPATTDQAEPADTGDTTDKTAPADKE